jgi:hypothetical protein
MALRNNNHGKFFSTVQSYMGYIFIACGIFAASYSLTALFLLIPGFFMAFTYTGTIIDTDNKRVKPYTSLFGFLRTGKWIEISQFARFSIQKTKRKYSTYSRSSVRFDMVISDIILLLLSSDGKRKVVINRYGKFEDAQKEMKELSMILSSENKMFHQEIADNLKVSDDASD